MNKYSSLVGEEKRSRDNRGRGREEREGQRGREKHQEGKGVSKISEVGH